MPVRGQILDTLNTNAAGAWIGYSADWVWRREMMFRVLICEDDADVSRVTKRMLVHAGYDVTTTNNGSAALEVLYRPQKTDLLLTDLLLPQPMSGLQLVTRARALKPEIPIVLMTGYSPHDIKTPERFRNLALLSKPFSRVELLQIVSTTLGNSPSEDRTGEVVRKI